MDSPEQQPPVPPPTPSPPRGGPPFQFSLKWLMVAVTVVAVIFALLAIAGEAFLTAPLAIFLRGVLPTIFVVCAIYGRSDLQTFAIGAVVPCVPLLTTDMGPISGSSLLAASIGQLFVSAICGVVAVAVRRWIVSLG